MFSKDTATCTNGQKKQEINFNRTGTVHKNSYFWPTPGSSTSGFETGFWDEFHSIKYPYYENDSLSRFGDPIFGVYHRKQFCPEKK
jgi:hypothetical protein